MDRTHVCFCGCMDDEFATCMAAAPEMRDVLARLLNTTELNMDDMENDKKRNFTQ